MIVVASEDLLVRLDPAHGGEILDLVDLATGRQLLGRPPFGSATPRPGDQEEEIWTESYRGGWQTVLPNAGNPCRLDGSYHGFHGRASADPWIVRNTRPDAVELHWTGHGLAVTKRVTVNAAVRIDYIVEATRTSVPLVAIEHLSVGHELLHPSVEIDVPAGLAYELDERDGPVAPPDACATWPEVTLLDGSRETADSWRIDDRRSRLMVLTGLRAGWCAIRNPSRDQGLALCWDRDIFHCCWMWHENRLTDGPWRGQTELLVVEPATVPHSLGLARAIDEHQALWLRRGECLTPWILARPCRGAAPVVDVALDGSVRAGTTS
jgi:hypothetical protein